MKTCEVKTPLPSPLPAQRGEGEGSAAPLSLALSPFHGAREKTRCASQHAEIRPLQTQDELLELHAAAQSDDHVVVAPTHIVVKGGEIIGYGSIGSVMMLNTWIHSQKGKARDSLQCLREAERLAFEAGHRVVCLPVAQQSPFLPLVERLGYTPLGWSSYNLKMLKGKE